MKKTFLTILLSYMKLDFSGKNGTRTGVQTNLAFRNADFVSYNIPQKTTSTVDKKDWEYGLDILHSRKVSAGNTLRVGALYNHWVAPQGPLYYTGRR